MWFAKAYTNLSRGRVLRAACLVSTTLLNSASAITGGSNASPGQFDYTMMILQPRLEMLPDQSSYICDGVLIEPNFVLTIAECVVGTDGSDLLIRAGTNSTGFQNSAVTGVIIHPNFTTTDGQLSNDIALLHLNTSITVVQPGMIVDEYNPPVSESNVTLVGWGASSVEGDHNPSPSLLQIAIPVQNHSSCADALSSCGFDLEYPQHFCVADYGVGATYGDAGGPVVDLDSGEVVGFISGNPHCASENGFAVELFISPFYHWIMTTIQKTAS